MKNKFCPITVSLKKLALYSVLFLALAGCSQNASKKATDKTESDIKDELTTIMQRYSAVGLSVAAVENGKIIYNQSLGYKDLDKKIPLDNNDIMRIASISKSFTTVGILQLVEQGKLSLDSDVSQIMGFQIRNHNYPHIPITVGMLLSHISSMSDSNGYFTFNNLNRDSSQTWQKVWNNYEPGSRYQYCNLGYNTLGAILEKVSGERFDKYIENHILKPLGVYGSHNVSALDSTRFIKLYQYNGTDKSFTLSSSAYDPQKEALENYKPGYSTPIFSPTGGMKISAADLAKVMIMHMNYGTIDGIKILDSSSCAMMQSQITPTNYKNEYYGMGIITTDNLLKGHTLTGHDGLALGAYTAMYWDKNKKQGFVVMTNGCDGKTEYDFANILCESVECLHKHLFADFQK